MIPYARCLCDFPRARTVFDTMIVFAAIPVGSVFSISARYAFVELTTLDDYYVVTFVVWYAYCYVDFLLAGL